MKDRKRVGDGDGGDAVGVLDLFICSAWAVCPKRERESVKRCVGDVRVRIPVIVVDITVR
jgi:hypothetical protein